MNSFGRSMKSKILSCNCRCSVIATGQMEIGLFKNESSEREKKEEKELFAFALLFFLSSLNTISIPFRCS